MRPLPSLLLCALLTAAGFLAGYLTMADYYGVGVLTVLVFYFFRGCRWWDFLGQLVCLYLLHVQLLGGYFFTITLFGREFEIVQQGLALLALLPIWLYRGRQGYHARWFQHFGYAFYPCICWYCTPSISLSQPDRFLFPINSQEDHQK